MAPYLPLSSPEAEADADLLVLDPASEEALPTRPRRPLRLLPRTGTARPQSQRVRFPLGLVLVFLPGLAVLALWQALAGSHVVPALLLPPPADVARTFWRDFIVNALSAQSLLPYAWTTLVESLAGFALGTLVALPLGYGIARSRLFAFSAQPYIAASQAMPAVALAPLLAIWLGYSLSSVIALCALIVFFPMVVNTVVGLRALDREVLDAARVDGAGWWALLRSIESPLALPTILAGMRTSLTLSVTGAVVGEFVLGDQGLGGLLMIARGNIDASLVFATLLMLALLAAALYGVARVGERLFSYLEAD